MAGKEAKVVSKNATKAQKKAVTAAPKGNKTMPSKYVSRPKDFGTGRDVPFKRDISRFMRWPEFVTTQRKKRVLERRMKVPAAVNQFRQTLDRSTRTNLFQLLQKYKPETAKARKERLAAAAKAKAKPARKVIKVRPLKSLKDMAKEHQLSAVQVGELIVQLGQAYKHASDAPRYSAEFGGKQMVVIPSKGLGQEVHQIMANTLH